MALRWLETTGGPFIALPYPHRRAWEGADPPSAGRVVRARFRVEPDEPATDYDSACDAVRAPRFAGLVRRAGFTALALDRRPLAVVDDPSGVVLLHWEHGASRAAVAAHVRAARFATLRWRSTRIALAIARGPLLVFDAARRGASGTRELPKAHVHAIALARGTYALDEADFAPDAATLLSLHRLRSIRAR